jgi:hypothetical protein
MADDSLTDRRSGAQLEKYVPPGLVDYGNVTKITAAPKLISGPDSTATKRGQCL